MWTATERSSPQRKNMRANRVDLPRQDSNPYLRDAILTAPPEQLHLMLYDGAIRFTRQGVEGVTARDYEQAFNGFNRAQKIILEMLNALNYDVDRELCTKMSGLYNFIYQKLVHASSHRDPAPAQEALKLLEYQRETWVMLIDKLRQEQASAAAPEAPESGEKRDEIDTAYGSLSVQG
jgi:flagellar protein FliS